MDIKLNYELIQKIMKSADIGELDFSVRSFNALKRNGINTIGDLCAKTYLDLIDIEHLGYKSLEEIQNRLQEVGLCLKPLAHKVATPKDWNIKPISDVTISFDLPLQLTKEQYELLKLGNIPSNMDDRWFICYAKHNLYIYRSWTGLCYYSVELHEKSGVHRVKAYVYNLEDIVEWKRMAPDMLKGVLEKYSRC